MVVETAPVSKGDFYRGLSNGRQRIQTSTTWSSSNQQPTALRNAGQRPRVALDATAAKLEFNRTQQQHVKGVFELQEYASPGHRKAAAFQAPSFLLAIAPKRIELL